MRRSLFVLSLLAMATVSTRASAQTPADETIQGVYAWTSVDGSSLELAMTVDPNAQAADTFSTSTAYVFHTNSAATVTTVPAPTTGGVDVICVFNATAPLTQCWAGTDYVAGDASATAGITSADGKVRVFAGKRNDPFYWNAAGFTHAVSTIEGGLGSVSPDAAGCPALGSVASAAVIGYLQKDSSGSNPGTDQFAGQDVLAIVVEVKKSLIATQGPLVSVWGATHVRVP